MTVKKKLTRNGEELQEVRSSFATNGFRWALIVLVASMHPLGRTLLGQMGFVLPDQAGEKRLVEEVQQVKADVGGLKKDIADVKVDLHVTSNKVDDLSRTFTGFQVDFERYRNRPVGK